MTKTLQPIKQPNQRTLVIGLLLLWLVGLGVQVWFTFGHVGTPREGSSEVMFARDMMAHHAQAVDMATASANAAQTRNFARLHSTSC
jgi:uncharacterized protein (DUF305 family)